MSNLNSNLQVPVKPGQIPTEREGITGPAYLTVKIKYVGPAQYYRDAKFSPSTSTGNTNIPAVPKEAVLTPSGVTFTLTAPGKINYGLVDGPGGELVDPKACFFDIYPGDSKSCTFTFINRDFESKLENPSSQTNTAFSAKKDNPIQTASKEQPQNGQIYPNQNAFVSPSINSDTSTPISNNEGNTLQSPQNNKRPEVATVITSDNTIISPMTSSSNSISSMKSNSNGNPSVKSFDPADTFKPGSGQAKVNVPSVLNDPSEPFTPGGGNPQVEGIPNQPNTNPQTPLNPGNVRTNIPAKGYVTVITKVLGFYNGIQASNFEVCVDSTVITDGKEHNTVASPPCATGSGLGSKYTVQAPGNVGIGVKNLRPVSYMVEHPLSMYIDAYESKTFTIYISPYPS